MESQLLLIATTYDTYLRFDISVIVFYYHFLISMTMNFCLLQVSFLALVISSLSLPLSCDIFQVYFALYCMTSECWKYNYRVLLLISNTSNTVIHFQIAIIVICNFGHGGCAKGSFASLTPKICFLTPRYL